MGVHTAGEAAREVALAADRLLGWDACFVALCNGETEESTLLYLADLVDDSRSELTEEFGKRRPASPVFLHALKSGPIVTSRAEIVASSRTHATFGNPNRHTESLLYVPIRNPELHPIGMLSIQSYEPDRYSASDLKPIQSLADMVAHCLIRLRLEDSLSAQDSTLHLLLHDVPAILWTTDRDLRFTSSTGAGLREIGLIPGQVVGMRLADYLVGAEATTILRRHELALAGETASYDSLVMGRSFHATVRPLRNRAGEIIGVVGIATDGTELLKAEKARRELEMRMLQTQKLESLGVLAGGISHDFNNLLVGVLGNAGLALDHLPEGHPAREPVELICDTGIRMRELTRQLLAYSGRGRFLSRTLELNLVVRETQELLRAAVARRAELVLDLSSEPLPIRGDQTQFRQLILNLATNASESLSESGGKVTLKTGKTQLRPADLPNLVELPASTEGDFALLEIEDNGCGIREELLNRVLDPFFTTKAQGRGLGMAAVQGIVRSHGGGIQISSTPRLGTTVRVFIPLNTAESTAAGIARPTVSKPTVLVAEDEPVVRRFIIDVLQREGLNVVQADNGEAAFTAFKQNPTGFSLVVLDIVMPRQSGPEAYLQMRRLRPNLPALFVSGASDEDLTRKGLSVSTTNFLAKPFTREALVDKVRAFI